MTDVQNSLKIEDDFELQKLLLKNFSILLERSEFLWKKSLENFEPTGKDSRSLIFNHLLRALQFSYQNLHLFTYCCSTYSQTKDFEKIYFGTKADLNSIREINLHEYIYSPIHRFYYAIENFFSNILKSKQISSKQSFNDGVRKVLELCELSKKKSYFYMLHIVRSCSHGNGISEHDCPKIDFSTGTFYAEKGKLVELPNLEVIMELLMYIVDALELVAFHEKLRDSKFISDKFTESIG